VVGVGGGVSVKRFPLTSCILPESGHPLQSFQLFLTLFPETVLAFLFFCFFCFFQKGVPIYIIVFVFA
jgi:hypothetical protein